MRPLEDGVFAHSRPADEAGEWEQLSAHHQLVGARAAAHAAPFGFAAVAQAAGQLHDIGKVSRDFQLYIRDASGSVDHSTAGARVGVDLYGPQLGKLLAFATAGHHAGLPDGPKLLRRLDPNQTPVPDFAGWEAHASPPKAVELAACRLKEPSRQKGFSHAFLIRMLFSSLVDADFVETERFYGEKPRGGFTPLSVLAARLQTHLTGLRRDDTAVNRLRSEVLDHATAKAQLAPGLFTLTVPTGGGKTLTSLSFALEHGVRHGLRRVVYVIPFTSIIEQTAEVFRHALASEDDVLEHHASFDWEAALPARAHQDKADAGEGQEALAKLRRAAENWEAPVVVTTAVQFFESLFANRTSRCRKLHNLAGSVIVLDEAQTLPLPLLRPCLAAVDELASNYGASVILCTATQPAVRVQDGFAGGLHVTEDRELAPDPPALYARLKRVTVERREGTTADDEIVARFAQAPQMLVIVNSRAHAHELFTLIRGQPGAVHLTTLMCPRHRREVLARLRHNLARGEPVRLVATSLIEAGVDISFPEIWRASTGLDSIAQAAGRCNRNDELGQEGRRGRVVVFNSGPDRKSPHTLKAQQQAANGVLRRHAADPLALEAVRDYFRQLYWVKQGAGVDAFDAAKLDGTTFAIMREIADRASSLLFPFESVARAFRLIDEAMEPLVVPWDHLAVRTLSRIKAMDRPLSADLRRLQSYVVPIPSRARTDWLLLGAIERVHPALGDALFALPDLALYDEHTGVRLSDPTYRDPESNIP